MGLYERPPLSIFIHAMEENMETKETKDNMTLPFYKFEFLFMQWRKIWKLRKLRII